MRALVCLALAACATDPALEDDAPGGGGKADDPAAFVLPGHDETLLAGDGAGKLALLHVGETFAATAIDSGEDVGPEVIRAHGEEFYALFRDGTLVVIDVEARQRARTIALGASALDIAWIGDAMFVSHADAIARWTGDRQVGRIDLAPARGSAARLELRRMHAVGTQLYVQVARWNAANRPVGGAVAVVDTTRDAIAQVIELAAIDDTGAGLTGLEPDTQMAFDEARGILYVTALGQRPSNTGGLFRIDTRTGAIVDARRAMAGFQGIAVLGAPWSRLFMIFHTSTPTTSSHLMDYTLSDDALEPIEGPALVDTFDGLDALAINRSGTLVAMANTCITGFCLKGAGIAFVDAHTSKVLPKLLRDKIGFEPAIAAFY